METTTDISLELFQTLANSVKKIGVEGTLKILRSKSKQVMIEDELVLKVVEVVAEEFAIDLDELVYEKYIRGDNKYAIGFCLHYLYEDYSIGELQKKGLFKYKDKSVLSRYRQLVDKLDDKHKTDMPYLKIKDKLDKRIEEIKNDQYAKRTN